ncbi:MAG: hypothetical protein NZL89_05935, partial [Leptospiraceae bacterium]|nr:hypothetical protein [Leptospiraceae bacterium]
MYRSPVCYLLLALLTKIGAQAPSLRWQLDREQILLLPNGNHVAGLLEFYLPPAVLANPDTAGFARAESVQLSLFGESYKWQRWLWQGSDITHPSRPGEPLLYLPLSLLHTVEAHKYAVLVAERNGIHLSTYDFSRKEGAMSFPVEIGGMPFLPRRTLDREPASEWGAPERSRGFAAGSAEAYAAIPWLEDPTKGFLFADAFYARRFFNTLA